MVELLEDHRTRLRGEGAKLIATLDVLDGKIAHYRAVSARK
ncbi:hypothetical protein [Kribbella shirazensis]|uniref:Uncharacterized protein n=1 Tax=Kribbella shirazensis TaxID=1105143 RepID=A0A7X5VJK0_9ACTN|nr:hypothetical protein [Kribbella shirazensis]NIK62409.1 hypothetical protein [Kribbella shirazensis]